MQAGDRSIRWFLAQLKPNCAQIADRNLNQQGFQTFLPLVSRTRRQNGKFSTCLGPLFPGYIFVGMDPASGGWRAINSTYGVTKLVSFSLEPAEMHSDIVAALMNRCDGNGLLLPPKALTVGDAVSLKTGPLADFVATVEQLAADQRVWVLMDLMGGKKRVLVDRDQLCHIAGPAA